MNANAYKTFPVFHVNLLGDANSFVSSWSKLYNYPDYDKYKSLVSKTYFERGDLRSLFEWKNGMNLSTKKENTFLEQILKHQALINALKRDFDEDMFEATFGNISAIWQIYLLHIVIPSTYPIFDQHVYRAFRFIQNQDDKDLPFARTAKIKVFYKDYYPFFLDMKGLADEHDHFEIDKALWTFGKMIKEYPGMIAIIG